MREVTLPKTENIQSMELALLRRCIQFFMCLKSCCHSLPSHVCIKDSALCRILVWMSFFLCWYGDCFSFQCIWKKKNHMWDAPALENERTDCSGFSWIVSIMVNGFSKCQSSCFIDLASQWGEQTHLDGILLTAKTAQCIHKPNQEEMWISLCPFVIHNVPLYPISDRSFPPVSWCVSITVSVTVYLRGPGCWQPLMFGFFLSSVLSVLLSVLS